MEEYLFIMGTKEKIFHLSEVNHQELLEILASFFGRAESKPKGYRYQKDGTDYFLEVQLDATGKIVKISPSKAFPGEELSNIESKIKETLINNQSPGIGQIIAFSTKKVEGYFRYKDLFQIIPVPDIAPKPGGVLVAFHPFLLQFSYIYCTNTWVDTMRRFKNSMVYIRLLNLFSNVRITSGTRYARFFWIMNTDDRNNLTSEWKREGYIYKGLSGNIDQYTPIDKFQLIKQIPHQEYYNYYDHFRLPILTSKPLKFPDNLEESFDLALSLNSQDWEKFFMACSWYYQAEAIERESSSSSFIALVNAIECLTEKPERCPECGQTITEGIEKCKFCSQPKYRVTKKFKNFLEKYVPFLEKRFPKERKLLYEIRSKLSHGLNLLLRDLNPWYFGMSIQIEEQDDLQRRLNFITRTAIYNWLRNREKK